MRTTKTSILIALTVSSFIISCNNKGEKADTYGNFEADEVTISSEVTGKIVLLNIDEGDKVEKNQLVAKIDTVQLYLKLNQLNKQIDAINSRIPNINAQVNVQVEQIKILEIDLDRANKMFSDGAATQKQIDDIVGRISLATKQKDAIETQKISVYAEIEALKTQIDQVKDQISRCKIVNPIEGVVLASFVNQNEIVMQGKALYKVADIDYMFLKAYISGSQLSQFQLGNIVIVCVDGADGKILESDGIITWVSSEAEFTPKIIQTKEERVKLVYPIKVKVKNNGSYHIGMPGEVRLITKIQ